MQKNEHHYIDVKMNIIYIHLKLFWCNCAGTVNKQTNKGTNKMWFKNIRVMQLPADFKICASVLGDALSIKKFAPCKPDQRESWGFGSPYGANSNELICKLDSNLLFTVLHQVRIMPAAAVKELLNDAVAVIEKTENRTLTAKEKTVLREQMEFELLPKTLKKTKRIDAWIDTSSRLIYINTSSILESEAVTKLLRAALGTFPCTPINVYSPTVLMTEWLKSPALIPSIFSLGAWCELHAQGMEQSTATFKCHALASKEVYENLNAGKVVSRIELVWRDKISFVLDEGLNFRRVRFLDLLADELKNSKPESKAEKMEAEFSIMSLQMRLLTAQLYSEFMMKVDPQLTQGHKND